MALADTAELVAAPKPRRTTLRQILPEGQLLPDVVWQRRHRGILVLLWLHAVGIAAFGIFQGYPVAHSLLEGGIVAVAAVAATPHRAGRRLRAIVASIGLITSSAIVVHFSGGVIEAHFHFFVVIGLLMLYQDWAPFLIALGYVVLHHGVIGVLDPSAVYNHPDAIAHPWRWAAIHGAFVVAASITNIVSWRLNEQLVSEPLTGLPGRTVFLHRLDKALLQAAGGGRTLAVLFVDLDRFKGLNDSFGHAAGDELLIAVSQRLKGALRGQDFIARLGGDEFAIASWLSTPDDAAAIADRIRATLSRPFRLDDRRITTSASIGIALSRGEARTGADLLRDADVAMYAAKDRGGNTWALFDHRMHAELLERVETEAGIRLALERNELCVFYQPVVALADGRVQGVEALVRWEHPDRGIVPPGQFIPVAEATGLIVPLGSWVLREACLQARRWNVASPRGESPYVCVNVSARQFAEPNFVQTVAEMIAETGVSPALLYLEVTESILIEDAAGALETLHELKRLGVGLALDDFGTGYSSLSYLRRLPCDVLKVDRSFVAALGQGVEEEGIYAAIMSMGCTLGMSVIAEGVETAEQADCLRSLGAALAQGYYFARPAPAAEFDRAVRDGAPLAALATA